MLFYGFFFIGSSVDPTSPTELSTVQFNVTGSVRATSTTSAFSRTFSKTVEADEEEEGTEDKKVERHLSECSFTMSQGKSFFCFFFFFLRIRHRSSGNEVKTLTTWARGFFLLSAFGGILCIY